MLIELPTRPSPSALPQAAPKACPASKSINRHCWQRPHGEVQPTRLFKHRVKRSPHRFPASIGRAARYFPSRGAKHIGGQSQGDTWVPLDASFKQYQYAAGMDLAAIAPFDASTFLTQAQQGATINEAEGWVQNLNQANVQQALTAYQTQLADAIKARKPDATVGDVLGKSILPEKTTPYLYGSLPYKTQAIGARYSELPARLRHRFHYSLYADAYSRNIDSAVFDYQADLPSLAGKKVTLAFVPANDAAAQAIEAMLPKPHADGSPIQPSELPTAFSHRIQAKAQLRVDGQTVAEGGSFGMGTELAGRGGFTSRDLAELDLTDDDTLIAGQQSAIGISVFGISAQQMQILRARISQTARDLEKHTANSSDELADDINDEAIVGDMLTAGVWTYFAFLQSHGVIAGRRMGIIDYPGLSYGFLHVSGKPNKLFGAITTGVALSGIMADIGHVRHMRLVKDDSPDSVINRPPDGSYEKFERMAKNRWLSYNRMRGMYASSLEHVISEAFFVDRSKCGKTGQLVCQEAVSAVKALQLAASEGQKIFTITQANINRALPKITAGSHVFEEIRNAVAAGKEVTIHERPIHAFGWSGSGYAVVDPETGAGAYLIEGGANGASLVLQTASRFRMMYGNMAWNQIRNDRTTSERLNGFDESLRNAEHFLYAYTMVFDDKQSRANAALLTYLYFIGKALIYDANVLKGGSISIPYVGVFDFRNSPVTIDQLTAGLWGAAYGSTCELDLMVPPVFD